MKKGEFFTELENSRIKCRLCPRKCVISSGEKGFCKVRGNTEGEGETYNYGLVSALNLDPIEKKPLYHFYPGTKVLSIGSYGCNLKCNYCQNYEISQEESFGAIEKLKSGKITPEEIERIAISEIKNGNIGVAYTYNEPIVWYEFMMNIAIRIKDVGLKSIMVSNGFVEKEPLRNITGIIDAFNIDLKGFTDRFYREITGGSLQPVLETLKTIAEAGKHLEITFLVIPEENDNVAEFEQMCKWIAENCGKKTILHISRYFPRYKMTAPATSERVIEQLIGVGRNYLHYVYAGNTNLPYSDTICPVCGKRVIVRRGYNIEKSGIDNIGKCTGCGEKIIAR